MSLDQFLSAFAFSGVAHLRFVVDCRERTREEMEQLVTSGPVDGWLTADQAAWLPAACDDRK